MFFLFTGTVDSRKLEPLREIVRKVRVIWSSKKIAGSKEKTVFTTQ